jgi:LPXTG-motif cell wall-anchored protein
VAQAQKTSIPTAVTTSIPKTGFADEVGAPALLGLAGVLLVIIFLARRLRMAH